MTFEERFPSFEKIKCFISTCDKQLFSERNNITNVIPEGVVKKYLLKHCVDNQRIKEAINKRRIYLRKIESDGKIHDACIQAAITELNMLEEMLGL